ncbi:unnamed protein product [Bemisia tabaci]|uniref:Uncharacterized protein n=1 Tax=Bemisia tabaci TaxID=7038 RepID=A0A9P0APB8_BEMTA|nr:unnamed protein product [Bemisia tabaci]
MVPDRSRSVFGPNSFFPQLRFCCCGCSLRMGVLIIGWFTVEKPKCVLLFLIASAVDAVKLVIEIPLFIFTNIDRSVSVEISSDNELYPLFEHPLGLFITLAAPSKSFDELLDAFIGLESNRKNLINTVIKAAENKNINVTDKFLDKIRETDEVFMSIRSYFDAGKRTSVLKVEDYLHKKMLKLSANLKTLEAQMQDLAANDVGILRPLINVLNESDQALVPIIKQLMENLEKTATQMQGGKIITNSQRSFES